MGLDLATFFRELKRRKVYQAATVYVAIGLGVLGAAELILDPLGLAAARPFIVVITLLGFPIALVLAWAYELRPDEGEPTTADVRPSGGSPEASPDSSHGRSIVVLPFDNLSPDPADSYFSAGLTEEVTAHLSYLRALRVISRSSAMAIKTTQKDARAIGRELNARYVLEGSVRKAGENVRITAQLIDADADQHLWTESYNGTLEDVFKIQEEVSKSIVEALDIRISAGEWRYLTQQSVSNIQVYDCYLVARKEAFKGTEEGLQRALRELELGIERFGESELLLQGQATVYLQTYEYGVDASDEMLRLAEKIANKIRTNHGESIGALYINGRIERFRGHQEKAYRHFKRVLELEPNHVEALVFGVVSGGAHCGRPDLVQDWALRLEAIDPLSALSVYVVAWFDWITGRLEESIAANRRALLIEPDLHYAQMMICHALLSQGKDKQADEILSGFLASSPQQYFADWAALIRCAIRGDAECAKHALSENTKQYFRLDPDAPYIMSALLAKAGAHDEAIEWLEQSLIQGWQNYPFLATGDPMLSGIRSDSRFKTILGDVKKRWESFDP